MAKRCEENDLQNLPACAAEYIKLVIRKMGYRRKVRRDVQTELAAHFEDELRDCKTDEEKERKSQRLIEDFGDAKLLGTLLRRAKKRCRLLWRTVVARTFQTVGVLILCFILYCVYISLGKPNISINYVEEANRLVRPVADESLNAAPIYQKAIDVYKEPPLIKDETGTDKNLLDVIKDKDWTAGLTEEELTLVKQWVSDNAEAVDFFIRASEKPYCWWERKAKDDIMMNLLMPGLASLRKIVNVMAWQAKLRAYDGNIKEAFEDLLVCYQAGRHLKGPRTLIEQLVGMAIQSNSIGGILLILDNQEVDNQLLKDLQSQLEELKAEDIFTISYEVERFLMLDCIQRCYTDDGRGSGHMIPDEVQEFIDSIDGDSGKNDEVGKKLEFGLYLAMSIASANRYDMRREFDKLYDIAQEWANRTPRQLHEENIDFDMGLSKWSSIKRARYWPVFMLMPALGKINEVSHRLPVYVESALTIIALLRYEQDTGDYPEKLDDLVVAGYLKNVPMDPWSDRPLVYKREYGGFMLYGIGSNFEDDGGEVARDGGGRVIKYADEGDWVFWPVQK